MTAGIHKMMAAAGAVKACLNLTKANTDRFVCNCIGMEIRQLARPA